MENENGFDLENTSDSFQALIVSPALVFQAFDALPIPIEIFSPDGTTVYANKALLEFINIEDANLLVGKYNLLSDSVSHELYGLENVEKMFRGEVVICADMPVPIQDIIDRGLSEEKPYEAAFMDIVAYPVWDADRLAYVVCLFIVKRIYQGRFEVARAKEFLDAHWQEKFYPDMVTEAANISTSQLYNVFKEQTGMTPYEYYKKQKVEHIKEKLADKSLLIKEAFAACGEDSQGAYYRIFKQMTGMSPREYRESL